MKRKIIYCKETIFKNIENRIHYEDGYFYFGTVKIYPNKEVCNYQMKLSIEEITVLIESINRVIENEKL